jgi:hypothetical protein
MKKILLASAAVLTCALPISANAADLPLKAAPMVSVPQATGYVEVYGGWASTRERQTFDDGEELFSVKGSVLGGAGRGNYWVTPTVSMQLDVQAEGTSYNFNSSSLNTASSLDYLIGGHVNWRDSSRGLFGAFAGIGDVNFTRHAVFGAEGQWYWNQFTLYGQVGYDTTLHSTSASSLINTSEGVDMDAWFVRGTGRYYLTPNLRLEATGMYADGTINPSSLCSSCVFNAGFSTLLWEAKAEWKLDNNPFSFFFKYRGSETDYNFSGQTSLLDVKVTDNRFLVGARMYLGEKSLLWNDRQGATLDIISPLAIQTAPLYVPSLRSAL